MLLAGTLGLASSPSTAAPLLNTTTSVTSSTNPALEGAPVTLTATVKILGVNLGPVTPKGTVTFSLDGSPVATVPVGSCLVLLTPCTASTTITAPQVDWSGSVAVTASYNGDSLAKPSTGSLTQEIVEPKGCNSDFGCYHDVSAANGSSRLTVSTGGDGEGAAYSIAISFSSVPLSCTTAGTGDTAVFDVSYDLGKYVELHTYDASATTGNQNPNKICWASDQAFTTSSGGVAAFVAASGMYEGTLPMCGQFEGAEPCIVGPSTYTPAQAPDCDCDPRAHLLTEIYAPAGDPKVTR